MGQIHPTALIDAAAELDSTVSVGAYSVVGPGVRAAEGVSIGPHCVVEGRTTIGAQTRIFQFCSIGAVPQDMKYAGEPTELVIGERNTIREFCTFNIGTAQDGGVTRVGADNWIMAYVHLAHDVQLGNHTVLANGATLAGHVHIGDWATIGGLTGIHQFVKVGMHAMVGFQSHVAQDVPPFMTVDGHPLAARAVNAVGLKRRAFGPERISNIREMHRLLYRASLTLNQAVEAIAALTCEDALAAADRAAMVQFLSTATRGIVR
jgi:UDP-N-acetylglucosamine acyltransferase